MTTINNKEELDAWLAARPKEEFDKLADYCWAKEEEQRVKNHKEFLSWGDGVVGESYGCWAWVEEKMDDEKPKDKFYWFARCLGALYHGDEALPFDEEEWVKTLAYVKKAYQYYFGEEMPTDKTDDNYALVQDALDAVSANASSCEKCGEWRMWGEECVECEKVQVGLRSGAYIPEDESEETKEGDQCECGEKFCRCDEGSHASMDDWECCEMCGEKTGNSEWFDENGTGILYCSPCENRMLDRWEARAKEEQKAKEEKEWEQEILAVCENRMKEENEKKAKEEKETDDESECDCDDPDCLVCDAKDDHCEMCRVRTDREEWVDDYGNEILYCEDCYNRMAERNEKKVKENPCEMCGGDDEEGCCETCGRHCEDCDNDETKRRVIKLEGASREEKLDCELIKKLTEA